MIRDFDDLSVKEMESLLKRLAKEIERRRNASREELRKEFIEKLQASGLELKDVFPEKFRDILGSGYRDPKTGATWSGRGHPPLWVKEIIRERGWLVNQFKMSGEFQISKGRTVNDDDQTSERDLP